MIDQRTKKPLVVTIVHHDSRYPALGSAACVAHAESKLDTATFDFSPRFVENHSEIDAVLAEPGHHILLFGNYLWSRDRNLQLSAHAKAVDRDVLTIHGGPSTPSRPDELRQFLDAHPHIDFAVFGEGENTFVEILRTLPHNNPSPRPKIEGCAYRFKEQVIVGPPRARSADLSEFASPYLTGRFPREVIAKWEAAILESNRGCPYGCTFCDWGSATMQKIRRFPMDRVQNEIEWIAKHQMPSIVTANTRCQTS